MYLVEYLCISRFGPRFPAMSSVYDKGLRCLAMDIVKQMGVAQFVHEGVYAMVGGPNFETVAEAKLLHRLGVDAVGTYILYTLCTLCIHHVILRSVGMSIVVVMLCSVGMSTTVLVLCNVVIILRSVGISTTLLILRSVR